MMMLFLVKCLHSYAIIHLLVCLYLVWDYGLSGNNQRWLGVALGSILLEALVFAASGFTCPLTIWAQALGDSSGTDYLSEVLYLDRINYVENYALFAVAGVSLAGWRYKRSHQHSAVSTQQGQKDNAPRQEQRQQ